jgi:hypothetical protein
MNKLLSILCMLLGLGLVGGWILGLKYALGFESLGHAILLIVVLAAMLPALASGVLLAMLSLRLWFK